MFNSRKDWSTAGSCDLTLTKLLDGVTDRTTFYTCVAALIADRKQEIEIEKLTPSSPYGSEENGWENGTIEVYLEAALSSASDNGDKLLQEEPSWQAFATFIYCGKIYE